MTLIEHATHVQSQLDQAVARIAEMAAEHAAELAAKNAEISAAKQAYDDLAAFKAAMEQRVSSVLQSGDPAQYEALAREFLTPAQELERQAKLAKLAEIEAEAAALKSELGV